MDMAITAQAWLDMQMNIKASEVAEDPVYLFEQFVSAVSPDVLNNIAWSDFSQICMFFIDHMEVFGYGRVLVHESTIHSTISRPGNSHALISSP